MPDDTQTIVQHLKTIQQSIEQYGNSSELTRTVWEKIASIEQEFYEAVVAYISDVDSDENHALAHHKFNEMTQHVADADHLKKTEPEKGFESDILHMIFRKMDQMLSLAEQPKDERELQGESQIRRRQARNVSNRIEREINFDEDFVTLSVNDIERVKIALGGSFSETNAYLTGLLAEEINRYSETIESHLFTINTIMLRTDDLADRELLGEVHAAINLMFDAAMGKPSIEQIDRVWRNRRSNQISLDALEVDPVRDLGAIDGLHERNGKLFDSYEFDDAEHFQAIESTAYELALAVAENENMVDLDDVNEPSNRLSTLLHDLRLQIFNIRDEEEGEISETLERRLGLLTEIEWSITNMLQIAQGSQVQFVRGSPVEGVEDYRVNAIEEIHSRIQQLIEPDTFPDAEEPMKIRVASMRINDDSEETVADFATSFYTAARAYVDNLNGERGDKFMEMEDILGSMTELIDRVNVDGFGPGAQGTNYAVGVMLRRIRGAMEEMEVVAVKNQIPLGR